MQPHRPSPLKMRSRYTGLAVAAGLLALISDVKPPFESTDKRLHFVAVNLFSQAIAEGGGGRGPSGGTGTSGGSGSSEYSGSSGGGSSGGSGPGGGRDGGDNGGRRGGDDSDSPSERSIGGSDQSGSDRSALGYDAARNMLQLHVNIGSREDRSVESLHDRPSSHAERGVAVLGPSGEGRRNDNGQQLSAIPFKAFGHEDWHTAKSLEALERAVKPIETHYQKAVAAVHPKAAKLVSKTKFSLGALSFSPGEILAVNMDAGAIERAQALGFTTDAPTQVPKYGANIVRLSAPPGLDTMRAQALLRSELPNQRFELNRVYRLYRAAMRDDSGNQKQPEPAAPPGALQCTGDRCFGRKIIKWQDRFGSCARGARIGVIDTEIDINHPAFKGRHIHRGAFEPDNRPAAPDWHGTGVLSVLAGEPASGTPGFIPDAEFYSASIFFNDENGQMATDTVSLLKALDWMKASDVRIINMSFSGPRDDLVRETIEKMSSKGVVFVAAAGNDGPTAEPSYPAAYPQVVAVTAVTKDLRNYRYANRGEHIDVSAPGVDIWSAVPGGREGFHSGTSFAAPHVAAILAILPRDRLQRSKAELLDSLLVLDLGGAGKDPVYGRGLLLAPSTCTPPFDAVASAAK